MTESPWFWDRLFEAIERGESFTIDALTDNGRLAVDPRHEANGLQNRIGSWMRLASQRGYIADTGRTERTRAPHGKGRKITVWIGTAKGRSAAQARRLSRV